MIIHKKIIARFFSPSSFLGMGSTGMIMLLVLLDSNHFVMNAAAAAASHHYDDGKMMDKDSSSFPLDTAAVLPSSSASASIVDAGGFDITATSSGRRQNSRGVGRVLEPAARKESDDYYYYYNNKKKKNPPKKKNPLPPPPPNKSKQSKNSKNRTPRPTEQPTTPTSPEECPSGIFPTPDMDKLVTPFPYVDELQNIGTYNPELQNSYSYAKITILGTQICWENVTSPIPWMTLEVGGSQYMHYAFPSWSVNTGKCLAMDQQGLTANDYRDNFVSIQNCDSSNQVFVFDGNRGQDGSPEQQSATIKLLTDIDLCMTFKDGREHEIIFKPCEINNDKFLFQEIRQRRDQEEEAYHIRGHGEYEDLCVGSNQDYTNPNVTVRVKMVPCGGGDAFDLGFIASAESMDMDIIIDPEINDFQYTSLGETFMGNPGIQLPTNEFFNTKHMVMYPWQDDHCNDGCTQPPDKGCDSSFCVVPCALSPRANGVKNPTLCDGAPTCEAGDDPNGKNTQKETAGGNAKSTCQKDALNDKVKLGQDQSKDPSSNDNVGEGKNQNTDKNHRDPNNVNQEYLGYNTTYNLANLAIRQSYTENATTTNNLGLGEKCTGRCKDTSNEKPCSCGTAMSPGCLFMEGYDCMTDTSFIPSSAIFVGCNENSEKQCTPAKPTGEYQPLLIPSGLNLRTCPDNVLDGQRLWGGGDDTVDEQTTTKCTMNDCEGEEHTGTMNLGGTEHTFCCKGEKSDPFSANSYGFFGVFPENGHFGQPGVNCTNDKETPANTCTFRPVCGCPTSIPALNMKVSGPGRVFDPVILNRDEMVVDKTSTADIQIMPTLKGDSTLRIYTVFKGSDDSFTAGDYVTFNAELVNALIDKHANYSDTENYLKCDDRGSVEDVTIEIYETDSNPYAENAKEINACPRDIKEDKYCLKKNTTISFNPMREKNGWNVRAPPKSIFDHRKIKIRPVITDSHLWMGPVFIGHPGKTYIGKDPDMGGIFTTVYGRPITGPGSAPGGTTTIATERFKAFFQCKLSPYTGTTKDPRIVYAIEGELLA